MSSTGIIRICLLLGFLAVSANALKFVCYYTNWAQYRQGQAKFLPSNIDPNMCTHIIYAFAKMNGNKLAPFEWNDDDTEWKKGKYSEVTGLKSKNPKLKVLLAVGGWNMGSAPFTKMVASEGGRREFCESTVQFLRKRNFDGLDLDWEYPAQRGSPPADKGRFTQLVEKCRATFDAEGKKTNRDALLLTAAVVAGGPKVSQSYETAKIGRALNFINVMAYDLRGAWDRKAGHHSMLYELPSDSAAFRALTVANCAKQWHDSGVPKEKLIIGIPTYARTFTLSNAGNTAIGAPISGPGNPAKHIAEKGMMSYFDICTQLQNGAKCKRYAKQGNIVVATKGNQWIGYDDPLTIQTKVTWLKKEGYGGAMIWALDLDDFTGKFCGQGRYPLLTAIKKSLAGEQAVKPGSGSDCLVGEAEKESGGSHGGGGSGNSGGTNGGGSSGGGSSGGGGSGGSGGGSSGGGGAVGGGKVGGPCTADQNNWPHPSDCSQFMKCVHGTFVAMSCPPNLKFNKEARVCDWPDNVQC